MKQQIRTQECQISNMNSYNGLEIVVVLRKMFFKKKKN